MVSEGGERWNFIGRKEFAGTGVIPENRFVEKASASGLGSTRAGCSG
jgi:hypothetical protein